MASRSQPERSDHERGSPESSGSPGASIGSHAPPAVRFSTYKSRSQAIKASSSSGGGMIATARRVMPLGSRRIVGIDGVGCLVALGFVGLNQSHQSAGDDEGEADHAVDEELPEEIFGFEHAEHRQTRAHEEESAEQHCSRSESDSHPPALGRCTRVHAEAESKRTSAKEPLEGPGAGQREGCVMHGIRLLRSHTEPHQNESGKTKSKRKGILHVSS